MYRYTHIVTHLDNLHFVDPCFSNHRPARELQLEPQPYHQCGVQLQCQKGGHIDTHRHGPRERRKLSQFGRLFRCRYFGSHL